MIRNSMMVALMVLALTSAVRADEQAAAPVQASRTVTSAPVIVDPSAKQVAPVAPVKQADADAHDEEFAGTAMLRFIQKSVQAVEDTRCTGVHTTATIQMAAY